MKEKFRNFMIGRYGNDQLNQALLIASMVALVISMFSRSQLLNTLALLLIVLSYFRMLSRNHMKRYEENQRYLQFRQKFLWHFEKEKSMWQQRKTHHIYKCPNCGQKIRVPRGKGKIQITCPKCRIEFVKKS